MYHQHWFHYNPLYGEYLMITLTTAAINEINDILAKEQEKFVRISIEGGGCSGFSYKFELTSTHDDDEHVIDGVIVIDPMSMQYLHGATLDYKDELIGSSFSIDNPNATSTCGCGSSFGA
jgi:iron-sulfur cluster insertion protein